MFIIFFLFLVSTFYFYFIFIFVTRHPPPATRHPPLVTRHPSPVTRHPSPATRHPRKSPAGSLPDTTPISRSPVQVALSPGQNHLLSFSVPQFEIQPIFSSKLEFFLFVTVVRFLRHFTPIQSLTKIISGIKTMIANLDSIYFM